MCEGDLNVERKKNAFFPKSYLGPILDCCRILHMVIKLVMFSYRSSSVSVSSCVKVLSPLGFSSVLRTPVGMQTSWSIWSERVTKRLASSQLAG